MRAPSTFTNYKCDPTIVICIHHRNLLDAMQIQIGLEFEKAKRGSFMPFISMRAIRRCRRFSNTLLMLKWESLQAIKARFQYFAYWSDEQMIECGKLAELRTYRPCEIIYAVDRGNSSSVHFILSGDCAIFQCLRSRRDSNSIRQDKDANKVKVNQPKIRFVEIGTLSCGAVFGLGEPMNDRAIAAKNLTVQCLLLPRQWLFEKQQNLGNVWQRIKIYLVTTIPQRERVLNEFVAAEKWMQYKKCVIEKSCHRSHQTHVTKYEDIPLMCRVQHAHLNPSSAREM